VGLSSLSAVTQGQPQRGIQIGESAQGQGEQPQGEQQMQAQFQQY
jgi:hypothetical protein